MARVPIGELLPRPHPTAMEAHIERKAKKKSKSIINTATRGDEDKQAIATPWAFIHALEQRFGVPVDFDLAAADDTKKVGTSAWFGPGSAFGEDALVADWLLPDTKLAYLNPPYANIGPWARKVVDCRWLKRFTVMLVPASYSTDWFLQLDGKVVRDAIPRIQFEGATHLYPKDLTLVVAGFGLVGAGYWDWRVSYLQYCSDRRIEPEKIHTKGVTKLPTIVAAGGPRLPDFNWTPDPFYKAVP